MCYEQSFCPLQLFVIPWAIAHYGPLSLEFSRQEYWSGLPFPTPFPSDPGIEPVSVFPAFWQEDSLPLVKMKTLFFFPYPSLQTCCIPKVRTALDHTVFLASVHFVTCWSWHLLGINKG